MHPKASVITHFSRCSEDLQRGFFYGILMGMASTVKVTRWSQSELPTEAGLRRSMLAQGLHSYSWSNSAGDTYSPHSHTYDKVIFVIKGSITFGLPEEGENLQLFPGDRLDLPAGILHNAQVGPQGVLCLEAHSIGE